MGAVGSLGWSRSPHPGSRRRISQVVCAGEHSACDSSDTTASEWKVQDTYTVAALEEGYFSWTPSIYGDYDVVIEIWDWNAGEAEFIDELRMDYELVNVQVE